MKRHAKKIGIVTCIILFFVAAVADILKIVLDIVVAGIVADTMISIIFFIPIAIWLFFSGRMSKGGFWATIITGVIGLIPILNALPDCIAEVLMIISLNNLPSMLERAAPVINKVAPVALAGVSIVAPEVGAAVETARSVDKATGGAVSKSVSEIIGTDVDVKNMKVGGGQKNNKVVDLNQPDMLPENGLDLRKKKIGGDNLDLREQAGGLQGTAVDENILDLENRRQTQANTGVDLPQNRPGVLYGVSNPPDALDMLNTKQSPTPEEVMKLIQAQRIMRGGGINVDEMEDPVLHAAWQKSGLGIRPYDLHSGGYKFNTPMSYGGNPPGTDDEIAGIIGGENEKRIAA